MAEQKISENLQRLLKLHGDLSISDLARATGIPQPTLHHIIEGKTKKPRRHALEALAYFFSVSVQQLIGSIPLIPTIPNIIKDSLKISTVPLIHWDLAKDWNREKYDLSKYDEIILDKQVAANAFALTLNDSSLEPLFQEKSILIFDPAKIPKQRDFVLVYLEKKNEILMNRLFIDGQHSYIKQERNNGDAELIKIHPSCDNIIATLIEVRMHF